MTLGMVRGGELMRIPLPPLYNTGLAWHYTSAQGLKGMISSCTAWATSAYMLNDIKEIAHGAELFRTRWDAMQASQPISADRARLVTRILDEGEPVANKYIYVVCASQHGDSLSQWRSYARNEGYALGFAPGAKLGIFSPKSSAIQLPVNSGIAQWRHVIYDPARQAEHVDNVLNFMLDILTEDIVAAAVPSTLADCSKACFTAYWSAVPFIKHEGFAEEQEVRLCMVLSDELVAVPELVNYRVGPLGLTPYVTITGSDVNSDPTVPPMKVMTKHFKIPVAEVRVGPNRYPDTAEKGLRGFLDSEGYTGAVTKVKHSAIPYR